MLTTDTIKKNATHACSLIACYNTVKAFIFASLYFRLFAAPDIFAGLNFRQFFASSKPSFELFNCSPGPNFHLLKTLAKMTKIKAG